ncbi:MAG TPA: sensor domain-containing protein [Thermoanaerobaculia bacterium]|nr:sensor domain-containing protein [Thermoanaerobaculia bacterium]
MSEQITTIEDYLERLRQELAGSDPALVQDALYDAEEFLRNASSGAGGAAAGEAERLSQVLDRFGSPREVAEAYRETEVKVAKALAPPLSRRGKSALGPIFGVLADPRAYGSLLYQFLSLITGILYFTWAVTGLSLSLGLSVLIFGLPFFVLFCASVRALSLIEGRLVESLLGVRMPRRPLHADTGRSLLARARWLVTDRRTWSTLLYMVLKLPLGILSFTLFTVLLVISLALLASPFAQLLFDIPLISISEVHYYLPLWSFPLVWIAAIFDLLVVLHLARLAGRVHGALAKSMLVGARA